MTIMWRCRERRTGVVLFSDDTRVVRGCQLPGLGSFHAGGGRNECEGGFGGDWWWRAQPVPFPTSFRRRSGMPIRRHAAARAFGAPAGEDYPTRQENAAALRTAQPTTRRPSTTGFSEAIELRDGEPADGLSSIHLVGDVSPRHGIWAMGTCRFDQELQSHTRSTGTARTLAPATPSPPASTRASNSPSVPARHFVGPAGRERARGAAMCRGLAFTVEFVFHVVARSEKS